MTDRRLFLLTIVAFIILMFVYSYASADGFDECHSLRCVELVPVSVHPIAPVNPYAPVVTMEPGAPPVFISATSTPMPTYTAEPPPPP
jgi:hypothetical protein